MPTKVVDQSETLRELKKRFKERMPTPLAIAKPAWDECIQGKERLWIKQNASALITCAFDRTYALFLEKQSKAGIDTLKDVFSESFDSTTNSISQLFENHFNDLDKFFLGLAQSRKARAGRSLEFFIEWLLDELQYPFTPQPENMPGNPDFVFPSEDAYEEHGLECIVLTAKTKVRERWKQVPSERTKGLRLYLAVNTNEISENQLREMRKEHLTIVAPKHLTETMSAYKSATNVISYEDFFEYQLDPHLKNWKRLGIMTQLSL